MANMFSRTSLSTNISRALRSSSTSSLLSQTSRPSQTLFKASPLSPTTSRLLSDSTRSAITSAIKTTPLVLFMKGTPDLPQCGFSRTTLQILGIQGVDPAKFTAFNVLEDAELRQGIKEFSNWPTIPQLYVNGEFVGGCDVVMEMHKDGSLADLLAKEKVVVIEEGER